jgi:hypothetical protein
MQWKRLPALAVLACSLVAFAGCSQPAAEAAHEDRAVRVEPVDGTDLSRVTLTAEAATRIGIETSHVERGTAGAMVVPYSSVLYDERGSTWVYTNPEGLTFLRAQIKVDAIDGDIARISSGPPAGTVIATVGIAQLFGAEMGVGDPE